MNYSAQLKYKNDYDKTTVFFYGCLISSNAFYLEKELEEKIDFTKDIVFDFKNLEYIASSGIRLLLKIYSLTTDKNIKFKIINVNDVVKNVLSITGLQSFFQ